jgi:hypothetical protein
MLHPKILKAYKHEIVRQDQPQLCDGVSSLLLHSIDECVGMTHDVRFLFSQRSVVFDILHPSLFGR